MLDAASIVRISLDKIKDEVESSHYYSYLQNTIESAANSGKGSCTFSYDALTQRELCKVITYLEANGFKVYRDYNSKNYDLSIEWL